ncbi:MAG TPA: hypothetical protein VMW63_05625 [Methanoregulaceae archaeon]|nr:hypothetical protein [Methanoregulaceae archaeon]
MIPTAAIEIMLNLASPLDLPGRIGTIINRRVSGGIFLLAKENLPIVGMQHRT